MKDQTLLTKATEDIQLIKEVIDRTTISLASFSKIFIGWGFLFVVVSIFYSWISWRVSVNPTVLLEISLLNYLPLPITLILAVWIYYKISKGSPLIGLSKQLMLIWVYIVALNIIVASVGRSASFSPLTLLLFSFSFGLLCTYVLTRYRFPGWLALLYSSIGVFFSAIELSSSLLVSVIWPLTFLLLGTYLKLQKAGVD